MFLGHGQMLFSNGDIYSGEFFYGMRTGFGRMVYSNKDIYEGRVWKN